MTTWIASPGLLNLDFFRRMHSSASNLTVPCLDMEYAHATQVWTAVECESMADCHDIYLKCDVLLLTDFFEKFRATCLTHYRLDAVHYYTAPGLAWDVPFHREQHSRWDLNDHH